jgi:hypothetical protein
MAKGIVEQPAGGRVVKADGVRPELMDVPEISKHVEALGEVPVEGGVGPCHHRRQPLQLAVQGHDRLAVGQRSRIRPDQRVDSGLELLEHVPPILGMASRGT